MPSRRFEPNTRLRRPERFRRRSKKVDCTGSDTCSKARSLRKHLICKDSREADTSAPPQIAVLCFHFHVFGRDQRALGEHVAAAEVAHELQVGARSCQRVGLGMSAPFHHPACGRLSRTRRRLQSRTNRVKPSVLAGVELTHATPDLIEKLANR